MPISIMNSRDTDKTILPHHTGRKTRAKCCVGDSGGRKGLMDVGSLPLVFSFDGLEDFFLPDELLGIGPPRGIWAVLTQLR